MNEKYLFKLQQILLNKDDTVLEKTRYMYYRSSEMASLTEDGAVLLEQDHNYDFSTYFNAFSIRKWKKYTGIKNVYLVLDIKGEFSIGLLGYYKTGSNYQKEWFEKRFYCCQSRSHLILKFPYNPNSTVIGFELFPRKDCMLYEAYYATEKTDVKTVPVHITLVTTTFKKEAYIRRNIELLSEKLLKDPEYRDSFNWIIIDNGRTLEEQSLNGNTRVVSNNNVGGAGGFCRGMLEALHQPEGFTHILLMDDDVVIQPESFKRLYVLLSLLKEEYRDHFISGAMLKMAEPNIQHEDIGRLNPEGYHEAAKRNMDLNKWEEVVENECFEVSDCGHYYAAWWFCCIPAKVIRSDNLPLPVFVRGDDVEYSLRNHAKLITMNGICIWHEGFEGKFSAALEFYQVCRNELIICAVHPEYADVNVLGRIQMLFWEEIYKFNYKGASLLLDAVEDFLKGPAYLAELDGEQSMKAKKALDNVLSPVTAQIRQQINYSTLFEYRPFKSRLGKLIYDYTYNEQARLPAFFSGRKTAVIPYGWGYFPEKLYRSNKVIAVDVMADKYVWYVKSRKEFHKLKKRYLFLMDQLDEKKDQIYRQYHEAKAYLVSEQLWNIKLNKDI